MSNTDQTAAPQNTEHVAHDVIWSAAATHWERMAECETAAIRDVDNALCMEDVDFIIDRFKAIVERETAKTQEVIGLPNFQDPKHRARWELSWHDISAQRSETIACLRGIRMGCRSMFASEVDR